MFGEFLTRRLTDLASKTIGSKKPAELSIELQDQLLATIFNTLQHVIEQINRRGYVLGLDVQDPKITQDFTAKTTDVTVNGTFNLQVGDQIERIGLRVRTFGNLSKKPYILVSPDSSSLGEIFYIHKPTNAHLWKSFFGLQIFDQWFPDCVALLAKFPDKDHRLNFRGFTLTPNGTAPH